MALIASGLAFYMLHLGYHIPDIAPTLHLAHHIFSITPAPHIAPVPHVTPWSYIELSRHIIILSLI